MKYVVKMTIKGKEVATNFKQHGWRGYPLCKGDDKKGYDLCLQNFGETTEEFIERLSQYYNVILIREVATCVRGYHNMIAYAKNV
jgi:hypothetical protein